MMAAVIIAEDLVFDLARAGLGHQICFSGTKLRFKVLENPELRAAIT
jgi:hypothetical protein